MSGFSESKINRHGAGSASGGQFAAKSNSRPSGAGLSSPSGGAPLEITPEYAKSSLFSAGVLREHLEADPESYQSIRADHDLATGEATLTYTRVWPTVSSEHEPLTLETRLRLDGQGNVVRTEQRNPGGGPWHAGGDEDVQEHQRRVLDARLDLAGVNRARTVGGGYSQMRAVGALAPESGGAVDAAVVSKSTRRQIKEAVRWGALPEGLSYSVRSEKFAGGQSVSISVDGMSDDVHFAERPNGERRMHGHARNVEETLMTIVNQWNDQDNDSMTDYFSNSYYSSVTILGERDSAFWEQQREIARAKRAAKKLASA